jgi:hypothetical protein
VYWHTNLVDSEVRIWADDGSSTEVHALSGKVATEATFLSLEALRKRLEGTTGTVSSGWDSASLVIEVGSDVVLKQFPQVLDNQLWRTRVTVLA